MAYLERVTVRLPKQQVDIIDMLVKVGEFTSRSDAMRTAVREMIKVRLDKATEYAEQIKKFEALASSIRLAEKYARK